MRSARTCLACVHFAAQSQRSRPSHSLESHNKSRLRCYSTTQSSPNGGTAAAASGLSLHDRPLRIAIVGAGPSGFYAASRLLGLPGTRKLQIHMFEELPVPFGLVRYGVAPDHPEVKNCIHKFEEVASDPRFRYHGNVQIGGPARTSTPSTTSDFTAPSANHTPTSHALSIPLSYLRQFYDGMLFTYGASQDRSLGPSVVNDDSAELLNVMSARSFVHWYNGHPHSPLHTHPHQYQLDLSDKRRATIIGQGNVALDCARTLLSGAQEPTIDRLAKTDTPEPVLAVLAKSSISSVDIVGRRGPLQFAGTTKELRELITLDPNNVKLYLKPEDARLVEEASKQIQDFKKAGGTMESARMRTRMLDLMLKNGKVVDRDQGLESGADGKSWSLSFCRSPIGLYSDDGSGSGPVQRIRYECNDLLPISTSTLPSNDPIDPSACMARGNGQTVEAGTDFVLKSVGYRSVGIPGLPFDERRGVVRNDSGRVLADDGTHLPGMYVSGWLARGPNGVIATTMYDAFQTAELLASDLATAGGSQQEAAEPRPDLPDLSEAGFGNQRTVSWQDWKAIDEQERRNGSKLGKEREKFVRIEDMLSVLG